MLQGMCQHPFLLIISKTLLDCKCTSSSSKHKSNIIYIRLYCRLSIDSSTLPYSNITHHNMGQFGSKPRSSKPHGHDLPSHCTKPIDTSREKSHTRSTHYTSSVEDPNARHKQSRKHRHAIVVEVRGGPGSFSKSESNALPRDIPRNTPTVKEYRNESTSLNCHHRAASEYRPKASSRHRHHGSPPNKLGEPDLESLRSRPEVTPPFELSGSYSDEKEIWRREEQHLLHPVFHNYGVSRKTVSSSPSRQSPRQTPSTPSQSPRQTPSVPGRSPGTPDRVR